MEWVAISFSSIEVGIVLMPNNDQWVPASLDAVLGALYSFHWLLVPTHTEPSECPKCATGCSPVK